MGAAGESSLLGVYARRGIAFESGDGPRLRGVDGRDYLDCAGGIAVNVLGHRHPSLVSALRRQADALWHVSNLYRIPEQERVAERLVSATGLRAAFFCNSGSEAIESAIKVVRKTHSARFGDAPHRIVCFEGAFHGRTLAAVAAGGRKAHCDGFEPLPQGFVHLPPDDPDALSAAVADESEGRVAAVMLEPIRGEEGIVPMSSEMISRIRQLRETRGILVVCDEIQSGMGRSGKFLAAQVLGIEPDVVALAKGLANGFPVGACLVADAPAQAMEAGSHGSTFGGNPLAMTVADAVLDVVLAEGFLKRVEIVGERLKGVLADVAAKASDVFEPPRGLGLMLGLPCRAPVADAVAACESEGVLVAPSWRGALRFLPSLLVDDDFVDDVGRRMRRVALSLSQVLS